MSILPIVAPFASKNFDLSSAAFDENYNPRSDSGISSATAFFWRPSESDLCIAEASSTGARKVYHHPAILGDMAPGNSVQETTLKTSPSTNETRFGFRCGQWEDAGQTLFLSIGSQISKYALATAYTGDAIRSADEQLAVTSSDTITGFFTDGTGDNIYFTQSGSADLYVRAMSTAFDITTMGASSVAFSIPETTVLCASVALAGTRLVVVNGDGDVVEYAGNQYDFANFTERASFAIGDSNIDYAAYTPTGKFLHTLNSATDVKQYNTVT